MNKGKARYENIKIPANLEKAVNEGICRARKQSRGRKLRHALIGTAAVVCILFAGANIMPIYSYAEGIPVLGSIVRVLHIGGGGEVTDGAHAGAEVKGESVELNFTASGDEMSAAPSYHVEHLLAPNRIVLRLNGVRGADFESIRDSLMSAAAVQDVYRNMILDDSAIGLTIVLDDGYGFEVTEYENPGRLLFSFYPNAESSDSTVYYLRTAAMGYTEQLGHLCERYHSEGANQVKTHGGDYIVTIGQYDTRAEAEDALASLVEKYGDSDGFYVASGKAGEIPEDAAEVPAEPDAPAGSESSSHATDATAVQTGENLSECFRLIGMDDAESASLLQGGEQNVAADGKTIIGRIYSTELFGESVEPSTSYGEDGRVNSVSIYLGEPDTAKYLELLTELYGQPTGESDGVSETGSTWLEWNMDGVCLRLYQSYGLCSISITPAL